MGHIPADRRGAELKSFKPRVGGGVEHGGADKMAYGGDYIADWFADTVGAQST